MTEQALNLDVPVHHDPTSSEQQAATRANESAASIRHAVRHTIIMAGVEGLNTRDIADRLYDYRTVRCQEDFHRLAAKANKVATRCLELADLGHIEARHDPNIWKEHGWDRDARITTLCKPRDSWLSQRGFVQPYPGQTFLHYWATPAGIAAHNQAVANVPAVTQPIVDAFDLRSHTP